jgi:hypothetical protein
VAAALGVKRGQCCDCKPRARVADFGGSDSDDDSDDNDRVVL